MKTLTHVLIVFAGIVLAQTNTWANIAPSETVFLPVRVNAGGPSVTDERGVRWQADRPYVSGGWGFVSGSPYEAKPLVHDYYAPPFCKT
jgi:hypothetical protein